MTNADHILELLRRQPGLDDDRISELTGIKPRQQVNQICRRLENQGVLRRSTGVTGKIVNYPVEGLSKGDALLVKPTDSTAHQHQQSGLVRAKSATSDQRDPTRKITLELTPETLLILPCSGKKLPLYGVRDTGPRITDYLPDDLASKLNSARRSVHSNYANVDEQTLGSAWRRYDGHLYKAAREELRDALDNEMHILILSGGYGVLLANEPIGIYQARLNLAWWPQGLLEAVIASYTWRHKLKRVIAVVSRTTSYRSLLKRVDWRPTNAEEVVLLMPDTVRRGAMVKAPRSQGEAISALISGKLNQGWRSSDGLRICAEKIQL